MMLAQLVKLLCSMLPCQTRKMPINVLHWRATETHTAWVFRPGKQSAQIEEWVNW